MYLIVNKKNPFFKRGARIRHFDQGWEQAVFKRIPGTSRERFSHFTGMVIPDSVIDMTKYALPILAQGLPPAEYMHRQKRLVVS